MIFKMLTDSNQICYEGVFGVTEHKSDVKIEKIQDIV